MNAIPTKSVAALLVLASPLAAQVPSILLSTSQTENTLSGSAGTVLQTLRPNEVATFGLLPCPSISAEKWAPRSCYDTMAGDDQPDGLIHDPSRFGAIDALLEMPNTAGNGSANQKMTFWSPSQSMGVANSLQPFRPGDTARIVWNPLGFGQVEYFLRAEDLQIALGLPPTPILVDLDAIAADPNLGVYFSIEGSLAVATTCGVTSIQDGDVLVIPAASITWTFDNRVQSVVPGCAEMVHTEAQMDAFVVAANVANATGVCVTSVVDVEGLEIDPAGPINGVPGCTGTVTFVPALVFTARTLTGCGVLTTNLGGQIWAPTCGPLATSCGSGPTLGNQLGIQPVNTALGAPSYVNAIATARTDIFVLEPQQHVVPIGNPAVIDLFSPGAVTFVFGAISPPTVAPCLPFPNPMFPDVYVINWVWNTFTGGNYQTIATPPVNISAKVVFQAGTFVGPNLVVSTPCTVEW